MKDTKECPFCGETIKIQAIKCRFCGEFLNGQTHNQVLNEIDTSGGASVAGNVTTGQDFIGRDKVDTQFNVNSITLGKDKKEQQFDIASNWDHKTSMREFDLSERNLGDLLLSRADFTSAILAKTNLTRTDLSKADLTGTNLSEAQLVCANLREAEIAKANLFRANLSETNLVGADFYMANLCEANLSKADLSGARLRNAYLAGANMSDAIFQTRRKNVGLISGLIAFFVLSSMTAGDHTAITEVIYSIGLIIAGVIIGRIASNQTIIRVDLTGAKYNDSTIWPKGFRPPGTVIKVE